MKKTINIILLCCLVILLIVGVYLSIPSKTLDFRGTITEITVTDHETTFKLSTSPSIGSSYLVVADNQTKIEPCHSDDSVIHLTDIKIGDTIAGNYRWFSKDNKAKFITVEVNH